jgi:RNA polymerase sigma factor (TIGR02999 family)
MTRPSNLDPVSGHASAAVDTLVAQHYDELRHLAHAYLQRERSGHTLQTTGLVNEAYLRLASLAGLRLDERTRFFSIMSTTMRRVLVDSARRRRRSKRGGTSDVISLDEVDDVLTDAEADELVVLDDALTRLERINPRGREVVQHRFFGGLTLEETADVLGVSAKTVQRDWLAARAWLRKEVARDLGIIETMS